MTRNALALAILIVAVSLVAGCTSGNGSNDAGNQPAPVPPAAQPVPESPETPETAVLRTVEITSSGFTPSGLTILEGETVIFVNKDAAPHWPASAVHPTHEAYPGSGIAKCGTAGDAAIFDACKGLEQGESFSFTFTQKGTWKYHDHLNPSLRGSITVE